MSLLLHATIKKIRKDFENNAYKMKVPAQKALCAGVSTQTEYDILRVLMGNERATSLVTSMTNIRKDNYTNKVTNYQTVTNTLLLGMLRAVFRSG